jgi:hypothetical protein
MTKKGIVQDPNQMREKFLNAEVQDEGGAILEPERNRPNLVWSMTLKSSREQQPVTFSPGAEAGRLNRMFRPESSKSAMAQKPGRGREITTPKQTTVRFI